MSEVTLGIIRNEHAEELRRLAERDTRPMPAGVVLGARLDGRLVAARSVSNGAAIADPFERTAELQVLLAERAAQLRGSRSRGGLLGRLGRKGRSRGTLPASPPGAGGKLLQI